MGVDEGTATCSTRQACSQFYQSCCLLQSNFTPEVDLHSCVCYVTLTQLQMYCNTCSFVISGCIIACYHRLQSHFTSFLTHARTSLHPHLPPSLPPSLTPSLTPDSWRLTLILTGIHCEVVNHDLTHSHLLYRPVTTHALYNDVISFRFACLRFWRTPHSLSLSCSLLYKIQVSVEILSVPVL